MWSLQMFMLTSPYPSPQHGLHLHPLLDRSGDGAHPCRLCGATFGRCDRRSSRNPKVDVGPAQLPATSFHTWSGWVSGDCMRPIAHGFCTMASNRLELVNKNPHDWQIQFKSGCMIQTWKSIPEVCHVCMVGSLSAVDQVQCLTSIAKAIYSGMEVPQESQQLDRLFYQLKRLGCPKVRVLTLSGIWKVLPTKTMQIHPWFLFAMHASHAIDRSIQLTWYLLLTTESRW